VEEDSGNHIFWRSDCHWRIDQAAVARQHMIDFNVLQSGIENCGMNQDQAQMPVAMAEILAGLTSGRLET